MSSGFFRPAQDGEAQQSVSERMPSSASSPKLGSAELFESVPSSASSRKFSSVPAQLSEIFIGQAQHKFCKFKTLGLRAKLSSAY
jgi:hypothetical protein